jgi:polysaccharide biosynthesis protein PelF
MDVLPKSDRVDIMLLLEGTFPYVSGGVSSWVDQMIRAFPEYRFGAVFLGSRPEDYGEQRYELPRNLEHLEVHYLGEESRAPMIKRLPGNREKLEILRKWHSSFLTQADAGPLGRLVDPRFYRSPDDGVDYSHFLYSEYAWEFITEMYQSHCSDPSFLDYFWTVRNMHAPLWRLAAIADGLIPAGLYHCVSTGYAGFLGAILGNSRQRPLILSEHGIYTKERRIDLLQSDWIRDNREALQKDPAEISYYRTLWMRFFETLGRICYAVSGDIISLYEGARLRQIEDGAPAERTRVIPNGIDVERFVPAERAVKRTPPKVLSLVGRVVPIKDIKTFIRAIRILADRIPEIEGRIVGPADEDVSYADECRALAESLRVSERVRFMGMRNVEEIYPETGVVVLSSISEGLPLVIIEAFAAGLPVVATDVGACSRLVYGVDAEDRELGAAGIIVGINDPKAIAEASCELLESPERWNAAAEAALRRVRSYYTTGRMVSEYRKLYEKGLQEWQA